jgi:glutaredoxin
VASIRKPDVAVFHSAGCHLCQRALEQVRGLRDELDFELREIDIAGDPALEETYRAWLPVVEIDGRRRFTYHVHLDAFRRAVARAAAES